MGARYLLFSFLFWTSIACSQNASSEGPEKHVHESQESLHPCSFCEGQGTKWCETCDGVGSFHCAYCDGTGVDESGKNCLMCTGTGIVQCETTEICAACGGTGNSPGYTCESCEGVGTRWCTICDGIGSFHCSYCDGTGIDNSGRTCLHCNDGIVKCSTTETCSDCNGSGIIY